MRILCIIPARIGSTRLAGKPLRLIGGEPLIRRVAQRVLSFDVTPVVVVATDDAGVIDAVAGLPVRALLTDGRHGSGTERVAEVVRRAEYADADVVLNVQGDEPLVPREALVGALDQVDRGRDVGTAAGPLTRSALWDANRVKVAVDGQGRALRFFRSPSVTCCPHPDAVFQHIGVYAYRPETLLRWTALPLAGVEREERLEQLRPLAHGLTFGVALVQESPPPGVDTAGDLEVIEQLLSAVGPGTRG